MALIGAETDLTEESLKRKATIPREGPCETRCRSREIEHCHNNAEYSHDHQNSSARFRVRGLVIDLEDRQKRAERPFKITDAEQKRDSH